MADRVPFTYLLSAIVDNRGRTCPTADSGIPLIATNCVRNELLYPALEKIRFVSDATYQTWFRGHPEPGDIIFVCKGTPGRVCLTPDPVGFCIAQDMVAVRADARRVYPRFLFALLRSPSVQAQIANMHVGSLIPHFKKGDFDKLLLEIPDGKAQRVVGDCYFDFSAKIELNRRTNETLEAMARALFKSWFVDFDPVRAKAEGRAPTGMDAETAQLFPGEFVDSELGPIPKGWRVAPFEEVFAIPLRNGLTKPKALRGAGVHMINMGELFAHRRLGNIPMDRVPMSTDEREKSLIEIGDLLFARQSLTLAGAGQCSIVRPAPEIRTFESHIIRCRISSKSASPWYFFYYLASPWGEERIRSIVEQVAAAGIRSSDLARLRLLLPPFPVQDIFSRFVNSVESRIDNKLNESRTLAATRDTLLPRLLSGEIPIEKAARTLEATA